MKSEGVVSLAILIVAALFLVSFFGNFDAVRDEVSDGFFDEESSEGVDPPSGVINGSTGSESGGAGENGSDDISVVLSKLLAYEGFVPVNDDSVKWRFSIPKEQIEALEAAECNVSFGFVMYFLEKDGEVINAECPAVTYTEEDGFAVGSGKGNLMLVYNTDGSHSPTNKFLASTDAGWVKDKTFSAGLDGLNTFEGTAKVGCVAFVMLDYEHVTYKLGAVAEIGTTDNGGADTGTDDGTNDSGSADTGTDNGTIDEEKLTEAEVSALRAGVLAYEGYERINDDSVRWNFSASKEAIAKLEASGYNVSVGLSLYVQSIDGEIQYVDMIDPVFDASKGYYIDRNLANCLLVYNTEGTYVEGIYTEKDGRYHFAYRLNDITGYDYTEFWCYCNAFVSLDYQSPLRSGGEGRNVMS